jgi:hypothetical protein
MKLMNVLCEHNAEFLNVKVAGSVVSEEGAQ